MRGKRIANHQFKAKCESHRAFMALFSFSFIIVRGRKC